MHHHGLLEGGNGTCMNCYACSYATVFSKMSDTTKQHLLKLSATDVLVQASMKSTAKCDNLCELQSSVNQWIFQCIWHFWVIPGSIAASLLVKLMLFSV
jgi:Ethanolamine utilization protein EutJ (predicted chaperonin)